MAGGLKGKLALAYAAGIIDGEGCISIAKSYCANNQYGYYLHLIVDVINTEEWLIYWLQMQFGGKIYERSPTNKNNRTIYNWRLADKKALDFLILICPYLQLKRSQAEIAIAYQKSKKRYGGKPKTNDEWAFHEAQRILLLKMKGHVKCQ